MRSDRYQSRVEQKTGFKSHPKRNDFCLGRITLRGAETIINTAPNLMN